MHKIKILYVIDKMALAGAQKHLSGLMAGLDGGRFEARLVTLAELGVKRIYGISGLIGLVKLVRLMKSEKPDIVHTYLFSENILGVVAARLAGVKTVITSRRDTGMLREGKRQHILAYRLTNRWVDKIVCVSEAVRRVVLEKERVSSGKVEVIYNGVDLSGVRVRGSGSGKKKLGIQPDELVVGMIANFSWIKGHADFIEAAKLVTEEVPGVKFLLVGDGPLKQGIGYRVQGTGIEDKVIFLGKRNNIPDLLSIMDVSVNASYSEGMSNAILESMAVGVPVVATAVDGNFEVVRDLWSGIGKDEATGILVPAGNAVAMAVAIVRLLKDRELAKQLGENGKLRIENEFRLDLMTANYERFYSRLCAPKIAFVMSQFPETHETFILRELRALEERGVDFRIYSLKPCRDKIVHPEARELMKKTVYVRVQGSGFGVQVLRNPARTMKTLVYVMMTYWKQPRELVKALYVWLECLGLVRLLKKEKIRHIHCHWATMPTTAGMILNKLTGIPFSFTAHAWDIFVSQRGLAEKIRRAEFVVTCTEYNRRYLCELVDSVSKIENREWKIEKKDAPAIYRNYHGLDLGTFQYPSSIIHSPSSNKVRLLAIGRLVEQKGFEYLMKACAVLKHHGADFELTIVGEGPLGKELELTVDSCWLTDKVKLVGMKTQEEIGKLYADADIFIAPSVIARGGDRDGIPNVILEAMALGVPVIATDVSGIPEVVINNETGLLVPERDPFTLAEAIQEMIQNTGLRKWIIENGRKIIEEKFNTAKNISELINIYRSHHILTPTPDPQLTTHPHPKPRLNVLYVIWSLATGGAERVVVDLVKGLDKSKYRPMVCCLNDKGNMAAELEADGVEVIALNKRGKFDFSIIYSLSSIIKRYNITIVHSHLWGANTWARLAAKMAGVRKVIAHEHGIEVWRNGFHSAIDRMLYRYTDRLIFVSEASKKLFLSKVKTGPDKCRVIYNGIDVKKFISQDNMGRIRAELGLDKDIFIITCVGRLVENKGHDTLIEAMQILARDNKKIALLLVGEGPLKEGLRSRVLAHGLQDKVLFLGRRSDVRDILSASNIFVLASDKEALPISVMEAMSCARAVVVTDVGGNRELVIDGETGLIVPPADSKALAAAIARIMRDPGLAIRMSEAARKRTEELFSMEKWIDKIEELYTEVTE